MFLQYLQNGFQNNTTFGSYGESVDDGITN